MKSERDLTTADLAGSGADDVDDGLDADADAESTAARAEGETRDDDLEPLLDGGDADSFRTRCETIQTGFVDEPKQAVEDADRLVAELMQRLAQTFSDERESLEQQWRRGDDVSTEDLRVGLKRYRSFFERLLAT
jgi:hypothetical protein